MRKIKEKIEWLGAVIPKEHMERFEVEEIIKSKEEVIIKLKEKKSEKSQLKDGWKLVLNGYDKSVEILTGSINGRAIYVRYILSRL